MTKKILALALAALMAFALVACNAPAEETLTMGTNAAFPPFEYVVEAGEGVIDNFDGIDILIGAEIAKDLGVSQMTISRAEKNITERFRQEL